MTQIIATNTTAGISLATGESLAVLASGSIVAPYSTISGSSFTSQTVSIAGYVEVYYLFLGGDNVINIFQSGTLYGHNTGIYVGTGTGANVGFNRLNNAGTIISGDEGVHMFGDFNQVNNTGLIATQGHCVTFEGGVTSSQVVNSGDMSSAGSSALVFYGAGVLLENTGTITSRSSVAVEGSSDAFTVHNAGIITGFGTAIQGSAGDDIITNTGTINGDVLLSLGADTFDGRGGIVHGSVLGAAGSDTYYVDRPLNIVELANDIGIDQVFAEGSFKLATGLEALTLLEAGNTNGTGNTQSNVITGNSGNNTVSGLSGNDTVDGGAGDDRVLGGVGGDSLLGNDGEDIVRGGDGADTMSGGDGDDTLIGGTGQDFQTGGLGNDTFVFQAVAQSGATTATADRISDFVQGTDRIDLSFIDAKSTGTTANDAFVFIGAAAFSNVAGQLNFVIDIPNNATYVQMDVNGDGLVDSMIRLTGQLSLNGGDFVL